MPTIDFSDEEHAAVTAAVRRSIADDKYPLSPRLAQIGTGEARSLDASNTTGATTAT